MAPKNKKLERAKKDLFWVVISVLIAIFLAQTSLLNDLLSKTDEFKFFGSFVAGLFFTSLFTIAPAAVALAEIAQSNPIWLVALVGGIGAVVGDMILFLFIQDHIEEDLLGLLNGNKRRKLLSLFHLRMFRFVTPILGALVIASPLPDELGLAMMGLSKTRIGIVIPISFVMNFTGIVLLGMVARAAI